MRVGFYSQITGILKDGSIYLPAYFCRFLESLCENVEQLTLLVHQADSKEQNIFDSKIISKNFNFVYLPVKKSFPHLYLFPRYYLSAFLESSKDLDVMIIRGPTPLMPALAKEISPIPTILMIVGDQLEAALKSSQPNFRQLLIREFWKKVYSDIRAIAKNSLVIVNSEKQYHKYLPFSKKIIQTRTTTLKQEEIYIRNDNSMNTPIKLLFSGRIELEKGILEIIDAISKLVDTGEDVILEFVGWSQDEQKTGDLIIQRAKSHGIEDRVKIIGYLPSGEKLLKKYQESDFFVIASEAEGFPRSIWEALSQGSSVVATKVGSIPHFIDGAAELIDSSDPELIAQAIQKLIHDDSLRAKYRKKGYQIVQEITLEKQTSMLVDNIQQWINERK